MTASEKEFLAKYERWIDWHKTNPKIWVYFKRFALAAAKSKRVSVSHWLIINRIRWEVSVATKGGDFKISNDYIAFYARLWKAAYPAFDYLFTTKTMKGEMDMNYLEAI